jgi:hypothetical protein
VTAAIAAGAALADGDPASDILPTQSVYFPISTASPDAQSALTSAVNAVYADGNRVKVAVIAAVEDLGAVPSLMNKPDEYARFLGQELQGFYIGPLLIVMPNGWGIYDGGRSVSAENDVLGGLGVNGSSVDNLVRSAATAVQRLEAAGALVSPDIKAPYAFPQSSTLHPGKRVTFLFRLLDDSSRAAATVTITARGKTLVSLRSPLGPTSYPNVHTLTWRVPTTLSARTAKLCMVATDAAGNRSPSTCVALKVAAK